MPAGSRDLAQTQATQHPPPSSNEGANAFWMGQWVPVPWAPMELLLRGEPGRQGMRAPAPLHPEPLHQDEVSSRGRACP